MKKTIITVVGKDTVGIIAKVCNYLAENQVNIEDISQTIVQGYFNMMMVTDVSTSEKSFFMDKWVPFADLRNARPFGPAYKIGVTDVFAATFSGLAKELENLGKEIGVVIHCQHEDIFNMMHRI